MVVNINLAVVKKYTKAKGVKFIDGYPDFSPWVKEGNTYVLEGLDGHNGNDFSILYQKMVDSGKFKNKTEAKKWISKEKLTHHHHQDGKTIELVPMELHRNVPHKGGASKLRNG